MFTRTLRTDVHQHLWPEPLVSALTWRREPPYIRRSSEGWALCLRDEPTYTFDPIDHDPAIRAQQLAEDGVQRALLAISGPLGIESLPRDEAEPLLHAHNAGLLALGEPFGVWGAVSLRPPDPADVDRLLDDGAVGLSLPAGALSGPAGLDRCGPLLERLERRGAPLFVHPGPGPLDTAPPRVEPATPATGFPGWPRSTTGSA